jgi:hypothetical protein
MSNWDSLIIPRPEYRVADPSDNQSSQPADGQLTAEDSSQDSPEHITAEILEGLRVMLPEGSDHQLMVLGERPPHIGFFDYEKIELMAEKAATLDRSGIWQGIYGSN